MTTPTTTSSRAGIRTTEFWLALIAVLAGAIATNYAETPAGQIAGAVVAALGTVGYGHSRAQVKRVEAAASGVRGAQL